MTLPREFTAYDFGARTALGRTPRLPTAPDVCGYLENRHAGRTSPFLHSGQRHFKVRLRVLE
jgi:hypothetical protein